MNYTKNEVYKMTKRELVDECITVLTYEIRDAWQTEKEARNELWKKSRNYLQNLLLDYL